MSTITPSAPRRPVQFLKQARADVERLATDDPQLAVLALHRARDLEVGRLEGEPLDDMAKTGDLSDCRKLYFGLGNPPSHRIVYRVLDETIEIIEIVAVEARADMYVYLLAALRLGRLPAETKPQLNRVHQQIIAKRARRGR